MKTIQASDIHDQHILIDVRTPGEFRAERIPNSQNMPLDQFEQQVESLANHSNLVLVCAGGSRARQACQILSANDIAAVVLDGGLKGWKAQQKQTESDPGGAISLERQVRIVAGALVATGGILSLVVHPYWALLSTFVGCGLIFAGITDTCGMAMLLAKLPYNNRR